MRTGPLRLLLLCGLLSSTAAAKPSSSATALDRYVAAPDASFHWEIVQRSEHSTHRTLVVKLTSQSWRAVSEVNRTEWQHWLTILVPKEVKAQTALLFINGGSNKKGPPSKPDALLLNVALATKTVVVDLGQVPNQPLRILQSDQPSRDRKEDDLLAASWIRFMETKDPTWLAQLPMAKSAVAAMDAAQQVLAQESVAPSIKQFTVAGGSKRGWTTWLAAIVDERVAAIAPIVIDVLNIEPSMRHHRASYGFWSEALHNYESQGLADRLSSPESAEIRGIVDPYAYRERLTLPKCLINAAGDEFFLPDSSRFYFDDLVGEKHLSYTPNTGHSLRGSNALDTLIAFHASVAHNLPRPQLSWQSPYSAPVHTVSCSIKPIEATLWRAVNPKARDFRHPIVGDAYQSTPLEPESGGSYRIPIEAPSEGFSATFARFTFDIGAPTPLRLSTPVWIAPDVEPFAQQD